MTEILVIDDSATIRKVTRRMLEELGFRVSEAEGGPAAQEQLSRTAPRAILLDWNMPDMDGLAVLDWLRQDKGDLQTKVVFCTTESDLAHIQAAVSAGADEYIFKPFTKDTLQDKLAIVGVQP